MVGRGGGAGSGAFSSNADFAGGFGDLVLDGFGTEAVSEAAFEPQCGNGGASSGTTIASDSIWKM